MAFIGKEPQTGAYNMLDALTASATASYSLTLDSTAFVPESANHLLVSLNGVIQKAGSSYTVSGSTLTFSSSLASSDSIDFVLALGNVLDIGTPSDATVTNAKTNFVSTSSAAGLQIKGDGTTDGTLQLNCSQNSHGIKLKSPAHSTSSSYTLTFPGTDPSADKFLKTDGSGNLSFADASGETNTPAFAATYSSAGSGLANGTYVKLAFDSELFDSGSVYNNSTYRFTPGVAGKYFLYARTLISAGSTSPNQGRIAIYKNGSVFNYWRWTNTATISDFSMQISAFDTANTTDYYEAYIYQNNSGSSTTFSINADPSQNGLFMGYKITE